MSPFFSLFCCFWRVVLDSPFGWVAMDMLTPRPQSDLNTRTNFNHERLTIAIGTTRQARVALSSAFAYCLKREAFGKTLMEQPVVRHRLAKAGSLLESQWAWIEQFVYQMCNMKKEEADIELGGLTAAAKANAGVVLKECADCAVLLFGGNGMFFPFAASRWRWNWLTSARIYAIRPG